MSFDHQTEELADFFKESREGKPDTLIPWLKFGAARIDNSRNNRALSAYFNNQVTDFEHDSAYAVHIELLTIEYEFTRNSYSFWNAVITTNPEEIKIYPSGFDPTSVERAGMCERCEEPHLMLPDGYYHPKPYEFAKKVAGKRINIRSGPRWQAGQLVEDVTGAWSDFRDTDGVDAQGLVKSLRDAFKAYES